MLYGSDSFPKNPKVRDEEWFFVMDAAVTRLIHRAIVSEQV